MENGSMRDALSLLDRLISTGEEPLTVELLEKFLGRADSEKIHSLASEMGNSNAAGALNTIEDLINTGLSEIQVIDSLIDCMRDLMIVKSAGSSTSLVTLTGQQRKRIDQLTEKFDIPGIIYNITALEKLRWTLKNSETARALLEASVLRLTLSEHFLNVNSLLEQIQGSAATSLKKNKALTKNVAPEPSPSSSTDNQDNPVQPHDLNSLRNNWQQVIKTISTRLGTSTAGLLTSTEPTSLENGVLTITFGKSAEISRRICESNGRIEKIQSALNELFSDPVQIKFESAVIEDDNFRTAIKTSSQKREDLINNPAVKTVITELNAKITGIVEEQ
jgi:DNA polymerase-3 subunit gamma/tau